MHFETYEDLIEHTAIHGSERTDRTGVGCRSVYGAMLRYNMAEGFPLITTKKVHFKSIVAELLWFLSGSTNVKDLQAMGCTIWDEWADQNGNLGPIYGEQWTAWGMNSTGVGINQIAQLVEGLTKDPHSRRHVVSAWNVAELGNMALTPCHAMFQCHAEPLSADEAEAEWLTGKYNDDSSKFPSHKLHLQLFQRSADLFLGVPFNIASYSLLLHMLAQQVGMIPGHFIWMGGDCHVYSNHTSQVSQLLEREPRPFPTLKITEKPETIFDYKPEHFVIEGYDPHPAIFAPVAV